MEPKAAIDLFGEQLDDLQAEGFGAFQAEIGGEADALIGDRERHRVGNGDAQRDGYLSAHLSRVGVLERIGEEFVYDQAAGDGLLDGEADGSEVVVKGNARRLACIGR